MVRWGNSNTLYLDSLGNFEHYGIGFVNFILLSDELRSLEISLFFLFGWNCGLPTTFVAYVPVRVIPPHKRYAVALIITIDFAKWSASTVDTIDGAQAWKLRGCLAGLCLKNSWFHNVFWAKSCVITTIEFGRALFVHTTNCCFNTYVETIWKLSTKITKILIPQLIHNIIWIYILDIKKT